MQSFVFSDSNEVIHHLAKHVVALASKNTAVRKRFSLVLSGGNSPRKLYSLLASPPYREKLQWSYIDFFFGDERYVPHTDPMSNYGMVSETLLLPLRIDGGQVYSIDTTLEPAAAARAYMLAISDYFGDAEPSFDLVLLGLGDNVHTASLFPHTTVLNDREPDVRAVYLEEQEVYRITLNAPLINLAKNISYLVFGADKAEAVYKVWRGEKNIDLFPAQLIRQDDSISWFMDDDASSKLI